LDDTNKFIFSQFVFLLGDNRNYRNEFEKNPLTENYKKLTISPFAIFNNLFNKDILFEIFNIDKTNEFIIESINWFENSILIDQLFNPSFSINYYNNLGSFRKVHVKEELPNNYIDCIVLLFVYVSIHSFDKKKLVDEFINYPIIKALLNTFHLRNKKSYSIINKLNNEYDIKSSEIVEEFYKVSDDLISIINTIFTESGQ